MEVKLGSILTGNEDREALHQPLIPLIAGEELYATDWVRNSNDNKHTIYKCKKHDKNVIGFIDPFIDEKINVGDKVYVYVNQGLIDGMRHHFTSPWFDDEDIKTETFKVSNVINTPVTLNNEPVLTYKQRRSLEWLEKFCKEYRLDIDVIKNPNSTISEINNEVNFYVSVNASCGDELFDEMNEFYEHVENYRSEKIDEDERYYINWDCFGCD